MKVFLCFISETSFYPAHLSFSITVKTTKLVLLRFHVLYLSTAALLMFTERLQFWDTPGLESVYEICNITIFFITTKKITKWKGIFHISTENCQKFLICAGFITFIFGKNFCFDQRGGKIISLNQKSLTKQGGHVNFSISFWACWCYPTFQKFQVVLTL